MTIFDKIEEHIISVVKFLEIKDRRLYTSNIKPGKWMYRGVKDYSYKLKPSIGRLLGEKPFKSKKKLLSFEQSAFNEFRINAYNELRENNQFIMLAVARHHGLKTRLLDWTLSPLMALFFAVEDKNKFNIDGALYAFQSQFIFNDFKGITSPFDENLNEYHFLSSPDLSPRIKAQHAVFQLFKDPTKEFSGAFNLLKFRIPAKNKKKIKRELHDLGISYKTVYPDLDGLCQTINYYKLCSENEK